MTVRGLLITLALGLQAGPSTALACHRYAVWRYAQPQRCGGVHPVSRSLAEPKDWYVEIVLTPQVLDEISHGLGIDKIKQLQAQKDGDHGH